MIPPFIKYPSGEIGCQVINWVSKTMDQISKGKTFIREKFDMKIIEMLSYLEIGLLYEQVTVSNGKELKVIKVPSWKDFPLVGQYRHLMKEETNLQTLKDLVKQLTGLDKYMGDFATVLAVFRSKNPDMKLPVDIKADTTLIQDFDNALNGKKDVFSQKDVDEVLARVASSKGKVSPSEKKLQELRGNLRQGLKPEDNVLSQAEVDALLKAVSGG